jgi:hypothetical protein
MIMITTGPAGGSHVNLAAYQAFAMQQRALLHQALTYDYLQTAAVTQAGMFPNAPGGWKARSNGVAFYRAGGLRGVVALKESVVQLSSSSSSWLYNY